MTPQYRRILLKLSGEALGSDDNGCMDPSVLKQLAEELIKLRRDNIEIGVVVGGGNIWRGAEAPWLEASTSHYMGMLATLMNALALRAVVESLGAPSAVISSLNVTDLVDGLTTRQAIKGMRAGKIVFFAAGTGQPYVTTDTGAVLWALKTDADVVLKATKVDGIYSSDPMKCAHAVRYDRITYTQAIRDELKVMDLTAFSLCMQYRLPIIVFKLTPYSNIRRAVFGEAIGTIVEEENNAKTSSQRCRNTHEKGC